MGTSDIGVFLPTMGTRSEEIPNLPGAARHAEALGFGSLWAVDQLVAGTGLPFVDSTVALAAAAAATERIHIGFGVMVLPLRPVVWAAKQVASLQHLSAGRALLGVGVGGDRHQLSWEADGVARSERGRRTDAALAVLGDLIAGKPVDVEGRHVQFAPGVAVPEILVGGLAAPALERAALHGGWFALPVPPAMLADLAGQLKATAEALDRPSPRGHRQPRRRHRGGPSAPGPPRTGAAPHGPRRDVRHAG